jgi:hypothetical protein
VSVFDDNNVSTTVTAEIDEELQLDDADDSHYVGLRAPAVVPVSLVWTLPAGDGIDGQTMVTNASGVIRWNDFLMVGGVGSPRLVDNGGTLEVKTTDGSALAPLVALEVEVGDLIMKARGEREPAYLRLREQSWGLEVKDMLNGKRYRVPLELIGEVGDDEDNATDADTQRFRELLTSSE